MAGTESVLHVSTKLEVKIIVLSGGVLKNEEKVSRRPFVKTVVRGAAALGIANTLEPFETFAKETKQRFDFCLERRGEGFRFHNRFALFMKSHPLESTTLGASRLPLLTRGGDKGVVSIAAAKNHHHLN
jgi:hypothetical protein